MLDNTITLAYDAEGDGTPVNVIIRRDQEYTDRSVYNFPDAVSGDHNLSLYRTRPKVSGNFKGVERTRQKLTKPVVVTGVDGTSITSTAIGESNFSLPKGMSNADKIAFLQELLAVHGNDDIRELHVGDLEV